MLQAAASPGVLRAQAKGHEARAQGSQRRAVTTTLVILAQMAKLLLARHCFARLQALQHRLVLCRPLGPAVAAPTLGKCTKGEQGRCRPAKIALKD